MACPPESPREKSLRSRVIWSFWFIILSIGLPTWYFTTSISRAALPVDSMLDNYHDQWYHETYKRLLESLPADAASDIEHSGHRAFKPSAEYHLTFSLFTAGHAPSSWDIGKSLDHHIQPILHAIAST